MIDHLTLPVSDYERSRGFYVRALAPLGYALIMELDQTQLPSLPVERFCGLGAGGKPDLWLRPDPGPIHPTHVAFAAPNREAVEAFYKEALAAGGRDNGAPGPRPHYHPGYYGAFVLDPDGYNIEAVCHRAPAS